MLHPLQYSVYKGTGGNHGALQFNFQPAHYYFGFGKDMKKDFTGDEALEVVDGRRRLKEGWKVREGAIFMEITSASSKNVYDWNNKITMALSITDMGQILHTLCTGQECNIMHDPGAKTDAQGAVKKFLNISSPKGTAEGVFFRAKQQAGGEQRSHAVPMNGAEVLVLRSLLQKAISKSLCW